MTAVKLEHIDFSYDTKPVLKNLNLTVGAKQITCLLGSSGSGKTSILRLIAGLETPQQGKIFIFDQLAAANASLFMPSYQRKIGYIFQDLALWPHMTVYQNLALGLKEQQHENYEKSIMELLDFFKLQAYANRYPGQLSGGQKQLVAIARAVVLKPKILLMDEPLANLDVKLKRQILSYIKQLKQNFDLTIIYVTHDHREAFALADRLIILNEGKIEATGKPEMIKNAQNEYVKYFIEY